MLFDADDAFLLPVAHQGHWLFSYASPEWDVDPDAPAAGLSPAEVGAARDLLQRYAPSLAAACRGRVFCDAYSPAASPSSVPGRRGPHHLRRRRHGSGYRLAPAIAAEVVSMVQPRLGDTATEGVPSDHQYV